MTIQATLLLLALILFGGTPAPAQPAPGAWSIVAWDSVTGDLGVAVESKLLAVGAVVPFAKAGVGAIATQAAANTAYGPEGLAMLEKKMPAREVVGYLTQGDSGAERRQIGVVDAGGNSFSYTGPGCPPYAGQMTGHGYAVQGNDLGGEGIITAMARSFEASTGELASRLLDALDAAERGGGDKGGRRSAALLVVRDKGGYGGFNDRMIDLRADDDSIPLVKLRRLYGEWQRTFYVDANLRTAEMLQLDKKYDASHAVMQRVVAALNQQLRDKPEDPDVLNSVARTLATNDIDRERALEIAKRASKLAPSRADILDTMAECHFRLGHFDEAIAIESELVAREPGEDAYWKQLQKFKKAKSDAGH
jgi:uncharacterized Ntn-hydrolase superfamily protein